MLHLHRAERSDRLAGALAAVVVAPFTDPLTPEVVAVPTRGVERWLTQRLSHSLGTTSGRQDGICANIDFPFPGRLVGDAVAAATGIDRDLDPWLPERLVWPLLDVVEAASDEAWLADLAANLAVNGDGDAGRRFGAVRHVADLFDRYGVHRPGMLLEWAAGKDGDGDGGALPADARWQSELWRRLRARVGTPSPAERLAGACDRLRDDPGLAGLPERLSLFGLTRLPASYLDVLRALAADRDVHLFLLHPSPALWDRVAASGARSATPRRSEDPTAALPRNRLLGTWGQDAREMQLVLVGGEDGHVEAHHPLVEDPGGSGTLLGRIQADVRADRPPAGLPLPGEEDRRPLLDPGDRSVQVHACHGRARQVEALRDAVLHLMAADPTLEPRDVIVMCPDIETFAPLIHATFGAGHGDDGEEDDAGGGGAGPPDLHVRLADRSLRQTNPVLGAVWDLLALAASRVTASQVADFASRAPVRRRFHLDDDDLARLDDWVAATGVRWGFDAGHRAPYQLAGVATHTWRAGLDRVLLGVSMAEDELRLVGDGALPLDDVDSGDIDLAGRLAELVDRLAAAVTALTGAKPVEDWVTAIGDAADALCATAESDQWQRAQLRGVLNDVLTEATVDGVVSPVPLEPAEVQTLLADRLRGRPTRANFRTGHLTVCTLVPMRSVPHRVVCLLGLDDEVFPRRTSPDGDDLVQRAPHVGDRDPRNEDRQLLLDAVLAATDHLVVTFAGRDERTNAVRPPAVPLGELLDVVDATVRTGEIDAAGLPVPARHRVVVHHPLQPFDARNFAPGALVPERPWSFDAVAREGARAAAGTRRQPGPFLTGSLPAPERGGIVELDQLVRFVQHPVRAFLRQRLGISVFGDEDEVADTFPVELDSLQEWAVGDRLLEARLAGVDPDACRATETVRGGLPPGALGAAVLDRVAPVVEKLVSAAGAAGGDAEVGSLDVDVALPAGRSLVGTVPGVTGDVVREVSYSSLGPKQRITAWVNLLAATASHPERPLRAATVGRAGRGPRTTSIRILGASEDERRRVALGHLAALVDLYDRGLREPLPLYCRTSAAYAGRGGGPAGVNAARQQWESGFDWDKEDRDASHKLVLGGAVLFSDLLRARPAPDESVEHGWSDEETRFGRYARRLWDGLLRYEEADG